MPSENPPAAPALAECRWQSSWLSQLTPKRARTVLLLLSLMMIGGVAVTLSPARQGFADRESRGPGDVALYAAEVERIAAGENYYDAAADELRARGYPTASLFNWRTPLPLWLLGKTSLTFGKVLLGGLCVVLLIAAFEWSAREGGAAVACLTVLLLAGGLLPCILGELVVMPMLWSGVCIALSLCLLGLNKTGFGVASGIAALFLRDLAGAYCFGAFLYSLWQRRYREAAGWAVGMAVYLGYFAWHVWQVTGQQIPGDAAHAESWIQLSGASFLLAAAQMHAVLLLLPQWLVAIYLPLALLGFVSWHTVDGQRAALAMVGFCLMFALVGQEFNQYWGALFTPLLCLGAARGPLALRDLLAAARPTIPTATASATAR